jgi:hypothetical protein
LAEAREDLARLSCSPYRTRERHGSAEACVPEGAAGAEVAVVVVVVVVGVGAVGMVVVIAPGLILDRPSWRMWLRRQRRRRQQHQQRQPTCPFAIESRTSRVEGGQHSRKEVRREDEGFAYQPERRLVVIGECVG